MPPNPSFMVGGNRGIGGASRGSYTAIGRNSVVSERMSREISTPLRTSVEKSQDQELAGRPSTGSPSSSTNPRRGKVVAPDDEMFSPWKFIEEGWFQATAACSIIANLVLALYELDNPSLGPLLFWPNQILLCFFIFELFSRIKFFGTSFLVGPMAQVVWNVMDVCVVALAIVDVGVELLCSNNGSVVVVCFKLSRVFRVFRLFRVLMEADLTWTKDTSFQNFIGVVIGINSLLMSLETDIDWWGWFYIEHVLLLIYSFELLSDLKRDGWGFFDSKGPDFFWNSIDFTIVFCSVLDSWLMPFLTLVARVLAGATADASAGNSLFGQAMMLMRLARLMRILRLVKLVKAVRPLLFLVVGVIAALQGVVWVLILTVVSLYAAGIVTTRLIGHKMIFPDPSFVDDEVLAPFVTVPESMFTLFRAMSGSLSQKEEFAIDELMKALPSVKFAFVFFMITSSWTLLSILTAVVSENMISTTQQQYEDLKLSLFEEERTMQAQELCTLFSEFDASGDGCVDAGEVESAMSDEGFAQKTAVLLKMPRRDILEVLNMMIKQEHDPKGVDMIRFVDCLIDSRSPVTERSIMKLESRMADLFQNMQRLEELVSTGHAETEKPEQPKVGMRMTTVDTSTFTPTRKSGVSQQVDPQRRNSREGEDAELPNTTSKGSPDGDLPRRNSAGPEDADFPRRSSRGSEGGDLPKRSGEGSQDGDLPKRSSRGSEGGDFPRRSSKGSQDGNLPKRNSRGSEGGDPPRRSSKGSQDGDLPKRNSRGKEDGTADANSCVEGNTDLYQSTLSPCSTSRVVQVCRFEADTDRTAATVHSDSTIFSKSVDQLVRRFGELERKHREDVESLCSKLDSKLSSQQEVQGTLLAADDFLMAAQQLQEVLVDRFNELERRHQDYFRTLFGKFEDFKAKEQEKLRHQVLGCPVPSGATDGLTQAREIVDFFADVPADEGEVTIQQAGARTTLARKNMKDVLCCSRV